MMSAGRAGHTKSKRGRKPLPPDQKPEPAVVHLPPSLHNDVCQKALREGRSKNRVLVDAIRRGLGATH